MKRRGNVQQMGSTTQLSLFGNNNDLVPSPLQEVLNSLETSICVEPSEVWERRRCAEMAEKLGWPEISLEPIRRWPGVMIPEGEAAWRTFLEKPSSGIGLVMLALRKILDPLYFGCIDESTGLKRHPVEVLSQREEWDRLRMMQLAEFLQWPRISWWDADKTQVIGPGEEMWRKYQIYGCYGCIIGAVTALERRLRGKPDQVRPASYQPSHDDGEEESW